MPPSADPAAAEGQQQQASGGEGDRLDRLEETQREQGSALERIEAALARVIPGSHDEAQQRVEDRMDRPSQVQEQVRQELARARAEQDAAAAAAERDAEHKSLKERVAALAETPPRPPARRATKLLGWGDGSK